MHCTHIIALVFFIFSCRHQSIMIIITTTHAYFFFFCFSSKLILFIRVFVRNNNLVKNILCDVHRLICDVVEEYSTYFFCTKTGWWFGYCNAECCNVLRHTQQQHHQTKRFLSFSFLFSSVRSLQSAATLYIFCKKRLLLPHCYFVVYQLLMLLIIFINCFVFILL